MARGLTGYFRRGREIMDSDIPVLHIEPATTIGAAVPWFRHKLANLGHAINPSSALASELELLEKYRAASPRQDLVKYRDAAELVDHQLRVRAPRPPTVDPLPNTKILRFATVEPLPNTKIFRFRPVEPPGKTKFFCFRGGRTVELVKIFRRGRG